MFHTLKQMLKVKAGVPDMFVSLERLKRNGFCPNQVIDVGAYEGQWTKRCKKIFPSAHILMVEAMPKKEHILKKVANECSGVDVAIAVLGRESGLDVFFSEIETASSVLEENSNQHARVKRKTLALNDVVEQHKIKKPDLLKLDVQGYELEVLKGFDKYLKITDVVLSEVSLLDIHKNVPLIRDFLNYMYDFGFVAFDICSTDTRRPLDLALWQTDIMFVKEDSVFRKDKRYGK